VLKPKLTLENVVVGTSFVRVDTDYLVNFAIGVQLFKKGQIMDSRDEKITKK